MATATWTPPAQPGNFPSREENAKYMPGSQALSPTTPLVEIDLIPSFGNPGGAYSIWLALATGDLMLGAYNVTEGNPVETILDSLGASSSALVMTPQVASGWAIIPAWTGGYLTPATPAPLWTATAGSISVTWNGLRRGSVGWSFRITGTSGGANQVYGFRVRNSTTGIVRGGSMLQNFTTSNAVTAQMVGTTSVQPGDVVSVEFNSPSGTALLTATMIDFVVG